MLRCLKCHSENFITREFIQLIIGLCCNKLAFPILEVVWNRHLLYAVGVEPFHAILDPLSLEIDNGERAMIRSFQFFPPLSRHSSFTKQGGL